MTATQPVAARLRRVDPAQTETQNALIAALNGRTVEAQLLTARGANERDRRAAGAWIEFTSRDGPVAIAPLLIDAAPARMTTRTGAPNGVAAAAALGPLEPLVAAIETMLAAELHPAGLSNDPPADAVVICVEAGPTARPTQRLLLAVAPGRTVTPLPLPDTLPPELGTLALQWRARIAVRAAPSAERLAKLAMGDLILLGVGPLVATLAVPGRHAMAAVLDWQARQLRLEQAPQTGERRVEATTDSGIANRPAVTSDGGADWGALQMPLAIEFDGSGITAAKVVTLAAGSVLPLPSHGGTLAVRVVAGEAIIADGELVAVGDGFGVLVTALRAAQEG